MGPYPIEPADKAPHSELALVHDRRIRPAPWLILSFAQAQNIALSVFSITAQVADIAWSSRVMTYEVSCEYHRRVLILGC